jgi:hypothetical protein
MDDERTAEALGHLRWGLVVVSLGLFLGIALRCFFGDKPMPSLQWFTTRSIFASLPLALCTQLKNEKRSTWFLSVTLLLFIILTGGNFLSFTAIISVGCLINLSTPVVRSHFGMITKEEPYQGKLRILSRMRAKS